MTKFSVELENAASRYSLLRHPFYQAWDRGALTVEMVKDYARQYYQHVKAFPRYISATHSICDDIEDRKILLENLCDEENNGTDHPTLWRRFATGIGNSEAEVDEVALAPYTKRVIDTFFKYCRSSYAEGLAVLHIYEHQNPEIARTKIKGLEEFYAPGNKQVLEFFEEHEVADIRHSEQCRTLLDRLDSHDHAKAKAAALEVAEVLWLFLTGFAEKYGIAA